MHSSEIDHDVQIEEPASDIDENFGHRPVLLEGFTPVDGSYVIVPVDNQSPESFILALTEKQAERAFLCLATQIGDVRARDLINDLLRQGGVPT